MQRSKKKVELRNHQREIDWYWVLSEPGRSFDEVSSVSHLISSAHALTHALGWAWLSWHASGQFDRISDCLTWFVLRAANGIKDPKDRKADWRGVHDWIAMAAAIFSGNLETIHSAAQCVAGASVRSKRSQYRESLAGILRASVLGERKEEEKQLGVFERSMADEFFMSVPRDLVRAFVRRDSAAMERAAKEGAIRHCSDRWLGLLARDEPLLRSESDSELLLDVTRKPSRFLWAFPEGAFVKLAVLVQRAEISLDDFWLPNDMVTARRSELPPELPVAASMRIPPLREGPVNFFARRRSKTNGL